MGLRQDIGDRAAGPHICTLSKYLLGCVHAVGCVDTESASSHTSGQCLSVCVMSESNMVDSKLYAGHCHSKVVAL